MAIVTNAHLLEFGKITHFYATVEWGIRCMLAGILEIPLVEALIISEPYSAATLKNVANSSIKLSRLPKKHQDEFLQIVDAWSGFSGLRNAVAHNRWEKGPREGSIKPIRININSGTAKITGSAGDRDWTVDDLQSEVLQLHNLNERAKSFHFASGLAEAIAAKDDERLPDKDAETTLEPQIGNLKDIPTAAEGEH